MPIAKMFKEFYDKGLITSRDGNACVQLNANEYLVTKSSVDKSKLSENDFIKVYYGRNKFIYGLNDKPSIETGAHILCLRKVKKTHSIHVHPPKTVALFSILNNSNETKFLKSLIKNWPELSRYTKLGKIIPNFKPGSSMLHTGMVSVCNNDTDIIVIKNHGVMAFGMSFTECKEHIERLEHISSIILDMVQVSGIKKIL